MYLLDFLITLEKLILISQSHMFSWLMELQTFSLLAHCWKFTIKGFSYSWSWTHCILSFNYVSKIPVVNQTITAHKAIYKWFGSGKYHKPHSILRSKSYEFQNSNIGLIRGSDTTMSVYFIGMHRDLRKRKALLLQCLHLNSTLCHWTANFPK